MNIRHKAGNTTTTVTLILAIVALAFGFIAFTRSGQDVQAIVNEKTNPLQSSINDLGLEVRTLAEHGSEAVKTEITALQEQLNASNTQVAMLERQLAKANMDTLLLRLEGDVVAGADTATVQSQLQQAQTRLAEVYDNSEGAVAEEWQNIQGAFQGVNDALQSGAGNAAALVSALQQLSGSLQ